MSLASAVEAQTPRYRLTPLVKLNDSAGYTPDEESGSMGINNLGQVVSAYRPSDSGPVKAWLWLPMADYGLTAGVHDLHTLSGLSSSIPSLAADINESGVIVGRAGDLDDVSGSLGAVWTISGGTVTNTQLGTLDSNSHWSAVYSVNDASPPIIVGGSGASRTCGCTGSPPTVVVRRGIQLSFTSPYTLTELSPSPDSYGTAWDVNTPSSGSALIAGYTDCADDWIGTPAVCRFVDLCRVPKDAVRWQSGTRSALTDLGSKGSEARSVNDAGNLAGWGFTDETQCQRRALYWDTDSASPVNLGSLLTNGDASFAESINHLSPPQVVGWNATQGLALLCEKDGGGNWTVVDLNDSAVIGGCESYWTLAEAHDINDNDWIITHGTANNTYPSGNYAILLTPFPDCPADVTRNGCINTQDLLAVIGGWEDCPIGAICHADVNGDCWVDTQDLLAVNAAWCPSTCPDPVPACCQNCPQCQDSLMGGGGGNDELEGPLTIPQLIALIGTSTLTAEQQATAIEQLLEHQE